MNPASGPELRDIHLPASPSWWPPAPGWWLLGALCLALVIFIGIYFYRKLQKIRRRRVLLAEFERTVAATRDDAPALAARLSTFLRRAALRLSPGAAALNGDAWLHHLDAQIASKEFSAGVGRALIDAPYRAHADYDAPALIALTRRSLLTLFERGAAHV